MAGRRPDHPRAVRAFSRERVMSEASVHPMFNNIQALADPATWQQSIDLAEEALAGWLEPQRRITQTYFVGHGSSLFNGQVGERLLERIAGIPSKAVPAF